MNKNDEKKSTQIIMFTISMLVLGKGISSIGEASSILTIVMITCGILGTLLAIYNYRKANKL